MRQPGEPYLFHFFGQGPLEPSWKIKVFIFSREPTFDVHGYRIDHGHLILYRASDARDGKSVRLDPIAVFNPGGWLGLASVDEVPAKRVPIGFEAGEPSAPPPE